MLPRIFKVKRSVVDVFRSTEREDSIIAPPVICRLLVADSVCLSFGQTGQHTVHKDDICSCVFESCYNGSSRAGVKSTLAISQPEFHRILEGSKFSF